MVKPRTKAPRSEQISGVLEGELAVYEKVGLFQHSLNQKTAYRYKGVLLQYQKALRGKRPSVENSQHFLGHLRESGFKPSTLRVYRAALQGFHAWRGENLVFTIKVPHHQPPYHSVEKVNRILGHAVGNLRDHVILRLQSDAGLRRAEVENLRVRKVDLVERMIHVRGKGDKDRTIPLTRELHAALESFCRDKGPDDSVVDLKSKGIYGVVKKYARLAGEPDFHPHDLRHAFATRLIEGGANIRAVQELLGHGDLATTAVYLGLAPKHLEEAIRRLENTTESGRRIVNGAAITQSVSSRPKVTNMSNDPLAAALKVMVEPANLYERLELKGVEEIQFSQLPKIGKDVVSEK